MTEADLDNLCDTYRERMLREAIRGNGPASRAWKEALERLLTARQEAALTQQKIRALK